MFSLLRLATLAATAVFLVTSVTVEELLEVLPDEPEGYGNPCSDRGYWQTLVDANPELVSGIRKNAAKLLTKEMPAWSDKDYLLYSQTGNRDVGQNMMKNRHNFVRTLVLAECFDMEGTYLEKAQEALVSYATQKTWVLAAHDAKLDVFYGRTVFVDLNAALVSSFLGTTLFWLGDSLAQEVRDTIVDELNKRTVQPMLDRLIGDTKPFWWQPADSNWNAVCFNGMITAILATVPSKEDRATALIKLVEQSSNYLKSFFDDGYGSEGVAYFNYGFGEFSELREKLCEATRGLVDLYDEPKVGRMAHAPVHFPMRGDKLAGFGDAKLNDHFSENLMHYIQFAYGESDDVRAPVNSSLPGLQMALALPLWKSRSCAELSFDDGQSDRLRHVYEKAQVAVLRGSDDSQLDMTFKVTGNGGHSHNDMGSYDITLGGEFIMGDAGGPLYYEARTFDSRRYLSPLMNSFGHPVPVVSGKNQSDAVTVQKKNKFVLKTSFTPLVDTLSTELAAAYDVKTLESVNRTVVFDRSGLGSITIRDTVAMKASNSVSFESVFTALGTWSQDGETSGRITKNGVTARVDIEAPKGFKIKVTPLADYNVTWTRIAVVVASKATKETVAIKVQPEAITPCNSTQP